jgi:hypothetical protein
MNRRWIAPLTFGLLISNLAFADIAYINLKCRTASNGDSSRTTFDGFMVADTANIKLSDQGITVTGRDLDIRSTTIDNPKCRNTYETTEYKWIAGEEVAVVVTKTRKWNALQAGQAAKTSFRICDRGSELNTYDSRAAFLEDIYFDHKGENSANTISLAECLVDGLGQ